MEGRDESGEVSSHDLLDHDLTALAPPSPSPKANGDSEAVSPKGYHGDSAKGYHGDDVHGNVQEEDDELSEGSSLDEFQADVDVDAMDLDLGTLYPLPSLPFGFTLLIYISINL